MKLAQGRVLSEVRGEQPVWLIDDIFGELDPGRRNAVMKALPKEAQKWITTTRLDWLEGTEGVAGMGRFRVVEGKVTADAGG